MRRDARRARARDATGRDDAGRCAQGFESARDGCREPLARSAVNYANARTTVRITRMWRGVRALCVVRARVNRVGWRAERARGAHSARVVGMSHAPAMIARRRARVDTWL